MKILFYTKCLLIALMIFNKFNLPSSYASDKSNIKTINLIKANEALMALSKDQIKKMENLLKLHINSDTIYLEDYDPTKTQAETMNQAKENLLQRTLHDSALNICRSGNDCNGHSCNDVHSFTYFLNEAENQYYFTKLLCSYIDEKTIAKQKNENKSRLKKNAANEDCDTYVNGSQGWFSSLQSFAIPYIKVCTTTSVTRIIKDVACAVFNEMKDNSSPEDFLNPSALGSKILSTASQAAISSTVVTVASNLNNNTTETLDLLAIVEKAQEHLETGRNLFSKDQIKTIEKWIEEANEEIKAFESIKLKELETIEIPIPVKQEIKEEIKEEVKEDAKEENKAENKEVGKLAQVAKESKPIKEIKAEKPVVTQKNQEIMKKVLKATEGRRPPRSVLAKENPKLLNLMDALTNFVIKVPNQTAITERDNVEENKKLNPAIGSSKFVSELSTWAHTLAKNAQTKTTGQDKKFLVAVSEPGTGKTTGIKLAASWANYPVCVITGEDVQKKTVVNDDKDGKHAWDIIVELMKECIDNYFTINVFDDEKKEITKKVMPGVILFDDLHFALFSDALGNPGHLNAKKAAKSRGQFFGLLKNAGDSNIETINEFSYDLAPGYKLPYNFARIYVGLTANELPEEFRPNQADFLPLQSRMYLMPAGGPNEEDRRNFAINFVNVIKKEIEKKFPNQLDELDENECKERLLEVMEEDIKMYIKNSRSLGIRGTVTLLKSYKDHVLNKLKGKKLDPKICSFEGIPELDVMAFDLKTKVDTISDYKKNVSEELAGAMQEDKILEQADKLRAKILSINKTDKLNIENILNQLRIKDFTIKEKQEIYQKALKRYNDFSQLIELSDADKTGENLITQFGYLQTSNESQEDFKEGEKNQKDVNRFDPLVSVSEDIFSRIKATRLAIGNPEQQIPLNYPIQITYTNPEAKDPLFFEMYAKVFGGLPVYELNKSSEMFSPAVDKLAFKRNDLNVLNVALEKSYSNWRNKDVRFEWSSKDMQFMQHNPDDRYYYYLEGKDENGKDSLFFLKSSCIEKLKIILVSNSKISKEFFQECLTPIRLRANTSDIIAEAKPELTVFKSYLQSMAGIPSAQEGILVIHLNEQILKDLSPWAQSHPDRLPSVDYKNNTLEAYELLKRVITKMINQESTNIEELGNFDLRRMTVFFNLAANVSVPSNDGVKSLVFGNAPISGRKAKAEQLLNNLISELKNKVMLTPKITDAQKKEIINKINLNNVDLAIYNQLIEYDRKKAIAFFQIYGKPLPTSPLELGITNLVNRVGIRFNILNVDVKEMKEKDLFKMIKNHYKVFKIKKKKVTSEEQLDYFIEHSQSD